MNCSTSSAPKPTRCTIGMFGLQYEANMNDLPDYELRRTTSESSAPTPTPSPMRPGGVWIAAAALCAAAGAAAYLAFAWRPHPVPTPAVVSAPTAMAPEAMPSLRGRAAPVTVPPLDASDTLVRTLVQALSESPAVMAWLPTKGLIRNFTVAVANIADGATLEDLVPPSICAPAVAHYLNELGAPEDLAKSIAEADLSQKLEQGLTTWKAIEACVNEKSSGDFHIEKIGFAMVCQSCVGRRAARAA